MRLRVCCVCFPCANQNKYSSWQQVGSGTSKLCSHGIHHLRPRLIHQRTDARRRLPRLRLISHCCDETWWNRNPVKISLKFQERIIIYERPGASGRCKRDGLGTSWNNYDQILEHIGGPGRSFLKSDGGIYSINMEEETIQQIGSSHVIGNSHIGWTMPWIKHSVCLYTIHIYQHLLAYAIPGLSLAENAVLFSMTQLRRSRATVRLSARCDDFGG